MFKSEYEPLPPESISLKNGCIKNLKRIIKVLSVLGIIGLIIGILSYTGEGDKLLNFNHAAHNHGRAVINRHAIIDEETLSAMNKDAKQVDKEGYSEGALADEIFDLPGLKDEINFRQFSGYLDIGDDKEIFYWFVESQQNVEEDPLILWTNGGPGCSGLLGFLTEHGPFWATPKGDLMTNKFSWNKKANIFYIEQPFGVGFSVTKPKQSVVTGDANAAKDMAQAIRSFITKFPKFKSNDVFISAESYGGHYMPQTALAIMEDNDQDRLDLYINFRGFLVGNPFNNYFENQHGFMKALYGHGILNDAIMNGWDARCTSLEAVMSPYCEDLYVTAYDAAGPVDFYAVDFPYCPEGPLSSKSARNRGRHLGRPARLMHRKMVRNKLHTLLKQDDLSENNRQRYERILKKEEREGENEIEQDEGGYEMDGDEPYWACASSYLTDYLNKADVQKALHVKNDEGLVEWDDCNDDVFDSWPDQDWLYPEEKTYDELVNRWPDLKIMIFSGDNDAVCGVQGTQYWLYRQNDWSVDPKTNWKEWLDGSGQLGGYETRFVKKDTGKTAIHFFTVRSAGHMVPQTRPIRGLNILEKYLEILKEDDDAYGQNRGGGSRNNRKRSKKKKGGSNSTPKLIAEDVSELLGRENAE